MKVEFFSNVIAQGATPTNKIIDKAAEYICMRRRGEDEVRAFTEATKIVNSERKIPWKLLRATRKPCFCRGNTVNTLVLNRSPLPSKRTSLCDLKAKQIHVTPWLHTCIMKSWCRAICRWKNVVWNPDILLIKYPTAAMTRGTGPQFAHEGRMRIKKPMVTLALNYMIEQILYIAITNCG